VEAEFSSAKIQPKHIPMPDFQHISEVRTEIASVAGVSITCREYDQLPQALGQSRVESAISLGPVYPE
jgi:hypothetical protein